MSKAKYNKDNIQTVNDKGEVVSAVDNAVAVGQSLKKEQEENKLTDSPLDDLEKIVNSR